MPGKILKFIIFTTLWLCSVGIQAQQKKYIYKRYGKINGLVADMAFAVVQDKQGYIWIATDRGLQRCDGKRFITLQHNSNDKNSLPANEIGGLHIDKKGRLWVLFFGNKVGILNTSNFKFSPANIIIPAEFKKNNMVRFQEDENGTIYFSVQNYGVLTYNEKKNEFSAANNIIKLSDSIKVLDITQGKQKNNYLLTTEKGFGIYNEPAKQWALNNNDPFLKSINNLLTGQKASGPGHIFTDSKGRIWFDLWVEAKPEPGPYVYCYNPADRSWTTHKKSIDIASGSYHSINGFLEQKNGDIWLYGTSLFAKFNEEKKIFEDVRNEYLDVKGIGLEHIYNLFEDKDANIWISSTNGLFMFNPGRQIFNNLANKRANDQTVYKNSVDALLQEKNGNIYASTWGQGIFAYDADFNIAANPFISSPKQNDGFAGWDMYERKNGEIWIAMQGGSVRIWSPQTKKTTELKLSVFDNRTVRQVIEDNSGNMWMGTQYGAIVKCVNGNWRDTANSFKVMQQLKGRITKLITDNAGFIWVCTDRHGLYKLNVQDGSIANHYDEESPGGSRLQSGGANDILKYNDSLFLIVSRGLNMLNTKTNTISVINTGKESEYSSLSNIVRDKEGFIWLAYSDNLCRMKLGERTFLYFGEEDGIANNHFQINASAVLKDGRILLGTTTDILVFDPAKIKITDKAIPVSISGFAVAGQPLLVDSLLALNSITLPYFKNSFSIDLATFSYQDDHAVMYMMEGLDDKWLNTTTHKITYSFLPPGTYTFKTKTITATGKESAITNLTIKIVPPFWKSWWFYGLLILSGIGIFYLADRERLLRIRATQKLRTDIALSLHDDVNTELNNINLLSEMARMKVDKDISKSKELIEQISDKSNDMIIAMDDMLWVIDPRNDNMEKTMLRMDEFIDALRNRHEAEIDMQTDKAVNDMKLDMKLRHGFFFIFKSALRCIVQHAGAKKVLVNIYYHKNILELTMQGNAAFKNTDPNILKCTGDMKLHAANINAELDIQLEKNGTNIVLIIPVQ